MLDLLSQRYLDLYDPQPQLSVDESIIGTKCWLSFIQYLPKTSKEGNKGMGKFKCCKWLHLHLHCILWGDDSNDH